MSLTFKKYLIKHETATANEIVGISPQENETVSTKAGNFLIVQRVGEDAFIVSHIIDEHYHENYLAVKDIGMIETHKPKHKQLADRWHKELERFSKYKEYVA
jgi:hypothetical protein